MHAREEVEITVMVPVDAEGNPQDPAASGPGLAARLGLGRHAKSGASENQVGR
mgnify:CR=1 FL=1